MSIQTRTPRARACSDVVARPGPATWAAYRSHLRLHILPRLGHLPLTAIRSQHVKAFVIDLKTKLSPRSAADVVMVLSMVLREAVEDRRIGFNPARGVKVAAGHRPERPHATPDRVTEVATRIRRRVGQVLVITAACTARDSRSYDEPQGRRS